MAATPDVRGGPGDLIFDRADDGVIVFANGYELTVDQALFNAVPQRHSTQADDAGRRITATDLRELTEAAEVPDVDLVLITDRPRIERY